MSFPSLFACEAALAKGAARGLAAPARVGGRILLYRMLRGGGRGTAVASVPAPPAPPRPTGSAAQARARTTPPSYATSPTAHMQYLARHRRGTP